MRFGKSATWWGPPKKFDPHFEERRISWLELFYDLVYVIAISRITHHLAMHINFEGFAICLFVHPDLLGWLNGSLYYDIHGSEGLRTRLMTLWQVMIIAALAVTIDQPSATAYINTTIVFMIMQLYITYLWWSVGFYDRSHRRYNRPYTILFLIALALMALSLFVPRPWVKLIAIIVIICNYTPPFIAHRLLRKSSLDLSLSSSMAERLGLFTIIVFGEVVLGVVNGISKVNTWIFRLAEFCSCRFYCLCIVVDIFRDDLEQECQNRFCHRYFAGIAVYSHVDGAGFDRGPLLLFVRPK
jgi:low temperature requirement protein LtrA